VSWYHELGEVDVVAHEFDEQLLLVETPEGRGRREPLAAVVREGRCDRRRLRPR
jgi:Holliday junction resolvase-like predicted endonuclease